MTEQATTSISNREWPSREEFLKRRQGPYWDRMDNLGVSRVLRDYATPHEIKTLRLALRERYRMLGREMQHKIKPALGPEKLQQKGETTLTWHRRVWAMSADNQLTFRPYGRADAGGRMSIICRAPWMTVASR